MPISRMSRADLPQAQGDGPDRAVGGDHGVERGLGVEMAVGLADRQAGQRRRAGRTSGPANDGWAVDPGPDGRAAERHAEELGLRRAGSPDRRLDLAGIALELLAEPDRRRVLEVGPTGLDDRVELDRLRGERRVERAPGPAGGPPRSRSRPPAASRVGIVVVRRLAGVDVVVRDGPAGRAWPPARWAITSFAFVFVEVPEPVW